MVLSPATTLLFDAQMLGQQRAVDRHEGAVGDLCGPGEAGVVGRKIPLGDEAFGRRDIGDPGKLQLLGHAILQGGERSLRSAACLGRIGGDMLDAELVARGRSG